MPDLSRLGGLTARTPIMCRTVALPRRAATNICLGITRLSNGPAPEWFPPTNTVAVHAPHPLPLAAKGLTCTTPPPRACARTEKKRGGSPPPAPPNPPSAGPTNNSPGYGSNLAEENFWGHVLGTTLGSWTPPPCPPFKHSPARTPQPTPMGRSALFHRPLPSPPPPPRRLGLRRHIPLPFFWVSE